jgi:hypothetical protein
MASLVLTCEPILDEVCSLLQAAYLGAVGLRHISESAVVDTEDADALADIILLGSTRAKELRRIMLDTEAQP